MARDNRYPDAQHRWWPDHGYLLYVDPQRFEELEGDMFSYGTCSQGISKVPVAVRKRWMLCLISTVRGKLTHVARSVVYYPAESGKDKLDIWKLEPLPQHVLLSTMKKKLAGPQAWRAKQALEKGGHISPSAFNAVMSALREVNEPSYEVADGLIDRREPPPDPTTTPAKANWAYQRDAVVTSLEIAGIPKQMLKVPAQLGKNTAKEVSSIFDSVDDATTIEDLAILQDLDVPAEDWKFVKRQRYPAKLFVNGDTRLTVILANKLPLELQLGVDLIYVNETLKSVIFVQYKMFAGTDGEKGYRPDVQLEKEIARMDALTSKLARVSADETCEGYRIGVDPFFLKFCKKLLTHEDVGHVPGIYVPLSYWKRLVKSPAAKGKRKGTVVYAETFGRRHLTPSNFIDMVGRGWIGTTGLQTNAIFPYLAAALEGKRGVVLAIQSAKQSDANEEDAPGRRLPLRKPRYPGKKRALIQI